MGREKLFRIHLIIVAAIGIMHSGLAEVAAVPSPCDTGAQHMGHLTLNAPDGTERARMSHLAANAHSTVLGIYDEPNTQQQQ